jgi:hypothetical protein
MLQHVSVELAVEAVAVWLQQLCLLAPMLPQQLGSWCCLQACTGVALRQALRDAALYLVGEQGRRRRPMEHL